MGGTSLKNHPVDRELVEDYIDSLIMIDDYDDYDDNANDDNDDEPAPPPSSKTSPKLSFSLSSSAKVLLI